MLKKRVLKRLLPLLFSFCFVFSGFLSVNAFAADVSPDVENDWFLLPFNELSDIKGTFNDTLGTFYANGSGSSRYLQFEVGEDYSSVLPLLQNGHTYLIYGTFSLASSNSTSTPSSISLYEYINDRTQSYMWSNDFLDKHVDYNRDTYSVSGICSFTLSEDIFLNTGGALVWEQTEIINFSGRCSWAFYALDVTNNTQDQINSIISAINNQTGALQGSIGQAADDVQQSIEDQYSGDPEEEFSVEDVITQHNEKMGVLSFGSDVMLQFLDMFQSANVGTAELTLPGFNITVENVEYSVWPDYSFNFEQLNEWVPALMSVIRVMLPAFVWLMVLRYCIKVFEDNFLAK